MRVVVFASLLLSACTLSFSAVSEDASIGEDSGDSDAGIDAAIETRTFAEMCSEPGVLFCDDFEDGIDQSWSEDGGDVRLATGSAVAGEGNQFVELATYPGQSSSKLVHQFSDSIEVYVRFDLRYASDYDNSSGSSGVVLGGSASPPWGILGKSGVIPDGSNYFINRLSPLGTVGDGGEFGLSTAFVNMEPNQAGDYVGTKYFSTMDPGALIVPGQWHCAEYGMTVNSIGNEDGRADFWVDSVHHGSFGGFVWRTDPDMVATTFILDSYNQFGSGTQSESSPNLVAYDNVVISTQPVGCLR